MTRPFTIEHPSWRKMISICAHHFTPADAAKAYHTDVATVRACMAEFPR